MISLPPSLREKKRHVAFELISEGKIEKEELSFSIWESILKLFGEFEGVDFKITEFYDNRGIITCNLKDLDKIKIALTMIESIEGKKVLPIILGVAGTIKSCKKKYMEVLKDADSANGV